eukprot:6499361-Pyramimonas_sp.AAC.1
MLLLRGSELYHRGEHPEGDNWHFLPGGHNYACAIDFAKYSTNAAKVCDELCYPVFDVADRP